MKYRFLTLISSLLLLTACSDSFLERAPEGNYVDVTFYTSDKALQAATAPLYNRAWFDLNQRSIVPLGSNRANDNFSRWGSPEFTNFKVTALNDNLAAAWKGFYSVITMANAAIYNPQIQISVVSGTKRSIFRQKNKTKRSKKMLHTTLIKPEQKVNEDLCSGFIVS